MAPIFETLADADMRRYENCRRLVDQPECLRMMPYSGDWNGLHLLRTSIALLPHSLPTLYPRYLEDYLSTDTQLLRLEPA
jgi:hypothetical protein